MPSGWAGLSFPFPPEGDDTLEALLPKQSRLRSRGGGVGHEFDRETVTDYLYGSEHRPGGEIIGPR